MKQTAYVAVVGAVNLDICGRPRQKLVLQDSNPGAVSITPGGVGRNIAHDLCLLGVPVQFLTVFGADPYGDMLRDRCQALGMELSAAETVSDGHTSTYLYITDERGEMQLAVSDTDIAARITPDWLSARSAVLQGAAAVVVDGNLQPETLCFLGETCTAPIFADPVSAAKCERLRPILPQLHTLKPNLAEGRQLTGESDPERIVSALLQAGVGRVYLSLGADGILAGAGETRVKLPCEPTRMVNTTGGGDAAMAALVWAYLAGCDLSQSTKAALRAGRITVEYPGTNNPELTAAALRQIQ